jgi:hypothetical protein
MRPTGRAEVRDERTHRHVSIAPERRSSSSARMYLFELGDHGEQVGVECHHGEPLRLSFWAHPRWGLFFVVGCSH